MALIYSRYNLCVCVRGSFFLACWINTDKASTTTKYLSETWGCTFCWRLAEYHSLPVCICMSNNTVGRVWAVWMSISSCGDQVLAVDYRWLAGFWISSPWYPLNVFTPFEGMSVLKYLSPFMFNTTMFALKESFFFFLRMRWELHNSQHPSKREKVWEKSRA